MTTYTCLILDDEPLARRVLEDYINLVPNLSLTASCKNAGEAMASLHHSKIDILFCDIKMPGIDGLQLMKGLQSLPKTIITSAHSEFAVEGFNLGVVDYLLKPISVDRFLLAVNRALGLNMVEVNPTKPYVEDFMFFKTGNTNERVSIKNIDFIEAYGNYCKLHLMDKNKFLTVNYKISELEKTLMSKKFIRVHKSYIVNKEYASKVASSFVTINNSEIPVGESYKKDILDMLIKKDKSCNT